MRYLHVAIPLLAIVILVGITSIWFDTAPIFTLASLISWFVTGIILGMGVGMLLVDERRYYD